MKTNDLKFFATFTRHRSHLFETRIFYVYYIGSPLPYSNKHTKNLFEIPLYIVELDNKTEALKAIHVFNVDLSMINYFSIGQMIQKDGGFQRIENVNESYNATIHKKKLYIPDPTSFRVRTMSEFINDTSGTYFQYLAKVLTVQKELIYTYIDQNGTELHIPAIEMLRHFYVDSNDSTLLDHVLFANAMAKGNLYKEFTPILIPIDYDEAYALELTIRSKKVDVKKLFYFLHNDRFRILFNDVWLQWNQKNIISAPIPSDKTLKIYTRYLENEYGRLVFNIFQSTLIDYDKPIFVEYQHPSDLTRKEDNLNRDPNYDKHQNTSNPDGEVDPGKKADPRTAAFHVYREEKLYDGDFAPKGLLTVSKPVGQQQDRGGKTINHPVSDNTLTALSDDRPGGDGTKLEADDGAITPPPPGASVASLSTANDINGIVNNIRALGHTVEGPISYFFRIPNCSKRKKRPGIATEPCNKTEAFIDLATELQRKYTVFKVSVLDGETFFCLDAEPKKEPKHILILFSDKDFDSYVDEVIDDLVFEQVRIGKHLWLRDNVFPKDTTMFKRISHTGDARSMASKIIDLVSK